MGYLKRLVIMKNKVGPLASSFIPRLLSKPPPYSLKHLILCNCSLTND